MGEPLAFVFDVGTQSVRAMLVDPKGNIVAKEQVKYDRPYFSLKPGWAEQRPDYYFERMCEVSSALSRKNPELMGDVSAVAATVIRDSILCLDENNAPLRDIIVWLDGREAKNTCDYNPIQKMALEAIGMRPAVDRQHRVSPVNWIMENEPEIWAKTAHLVMLPTYLNYLMTGRLIDCAANMIGHVPFDYKRRRWAPKGNFTRCVCDIPEEKLISLLPSGAVIGVITPQASARMGLPEGLELIASGSDKGCETLGLSVIRKDQAALSFGTSATIQFATRDYFEPQQFMPAYPAVPNDMYNPEIQIYRGYWMITWFKNEFAHKECRDAEQLGVAPEVLLNRRLSEVPAGCDGLVLQPFWSPGVAQPSARGAVIGFSDVHTRAHLYRAIIEGIGFALMDGMYTMEKRGGQKIRELFIGGGGSQSDEIAQITANMFGLPVKRIQTHEACGLGAAMVVFVAKGIFQSYENAISEMVRVKDEFLPNGEEHRLYLRLYAGIYRKIFRHLEPLYRRLRALTQREEQ